MIDPSKLDFPKFLTPLSEVEGNHRAFRIFVRMVACTLSAGRREEEYLSEAGRLTKEQLDAVGRAFGSLVREAGEHPYQDLLGPYYMHIAHSMDRSDRGEFYTPPEVSSLIGKLAMPPEWPPFGHVRIHEPACGTGGMLLAVVEEMHDRGIAPERVYFEAWDLSEGACDAAFVNLSLWGVPARIVWGDTLRMTTSASWETVFRPRMEARHWRVAFDRVLKETA